MAVADLRREYGIPLAEWESLDAAEWVCLLLGLSDASRLRAAVAAEQASSATVEGMARQTAQTHDPERFLANLRRHKGPVEIVKGADQ